MIITKIAGGLGNQMFQYAFGKSLSIKFQTELFLDIQTTNTNKKYTDRLFELSLFNIQNFNLGLPENYNYSNFNLKVGAFNISRKLHQLFPSISNRIFVEDFGNSYNKNFKKN